MDRIRRNTVRVVGLAASLWVVGAIVIAPARSTASDETAAGHKRPRGEAVARSSNDWREHVNQVLQLRASSVVTLNPEATTGQAVTVTVPIAGTARTLDLQQQSVRAATYQLKVQLADGSIVDAEPGPVRTLRGSVAGIEGSAVAASLEQDGLYARVFLPDDEQYWIEPLAPRFTGAGPNHYVVYHNDDIIDPQKTCGLDALPNALGDRGVSSPIRNAQGGACGTGLCVAEIAADADFEYFQD